MTTLSLAYKVRQRRYAAIRQMDKSLERFIPRRCMVVSSGIFLAGLSIPALMMFGVIPINLLTAAIGLALTALGGVLALTLCGEI